MRPSGRNNHELREFKFIKDFSNHAEGSVLVEFGDTKVLCTASVITGVPKFLKGKNQGWVTAEYGMLPRATNERTAREAVKGRQSGRTQEIQRLIGRAMRNSVNLKKLGENTITIDCDVIQADGSTRCAAINGACVALGLAVENMCRTKKIKDNPIKHLVAAASVGIYQNSPILDLDYKEDSNSETDMNVVMTSTGKFIEIQGTAEGVAFDDSELGGMLELAKAGIKEIVDKQKIVLGYNH